MVAYHVTLNGQGYLLDLARYQKRPRPAFVSRQAQGAVSLADLRGPELVFTLSDWSAGEGAVEHDPAAPGRWRQGGGIDGSTAPGTLRLGPSVSLVQATTESQLTAMAVYQGTLYLGANTGKIFTWDGATWTHLHTLGGPVSALETFLNRLYAGNWTNGNLATFNGTTWSVAATAGGPILSLATHYRQAAQYLYLGSAGAGTNGLGRVSYYDGATLSAGQLDPEEPYPQRMAVLRNRLYLVGSDQPSRGWRLYSLDDSGSGGTWRVEARVPGTGYAVSLAVVADVLYLGDALGGRIWAWDGARLTLVRELEAPGSPYPATLFGLTAWRGALWVLAVESGTLSLLRYDRQGWSRPVTGLVGSGPGALAVYNGDLYVGTQQPGAARLYRVQASAYGASGSLEQGLLDFGLPGVVKLLRSATLVTAPLASGQSVQLQYRLEDSGPWLTLGTLATAGATTATFSFPAATTGRVLALRLLLGGTAGSSSSPILHQLTVRYVPRPPLTREWTLAVLLEGTPELPLVTLDGAPEPLTGAQLTSALWAAAASSGPLTFVDLDGASYSVYVEDLREEVARLSQRLGYQRLGLVTLVEAA